MGLAGVASSPPQAAIQSGHTVPSAPPPRAVSRAAPQTWSQPDAKRPRPDGAVPNSAPPSYSSVGIFGVMPLGVALGPDGQPIRPPAHHGVGDVAPSSKHARMMQKIAMQLNQPASALRGRLYQFAADILFDIVLSNEPMDPVARQDAINVSDTLYEGLYNRIMAESRMPQLAHLAHWDGQEVPVPHATLTDLSQSGPGWLPYAAHFSRPRKRGILVPPRQKPWGW